MRILITAGPTREPIDPVRYIGNRSSGTMGRFLAEAAIRNGHAVTLILGPVTAPMPRAARRIDVETSAQMHDAVLTEFTNHDLLIMAAAVADYRPTTYMQEKIERAGSLTIQLEATPDILADVGRIKRSDQRTIGFSLVSHSDLARSIEKLHRKRLDLMVSNPLETVNSDAVSAVLLWPDGRTQELPYRTKAEFADNLLVRAIELFDGRSSKLRAPGV